jgi:hypothetical protein
MAGHETELHHQQQLGDGILTGIRRDLETEEGAVLGHQAAREPQHLVEHRLRHDDEAVLFRLEGMRGGLIAANAYLLKMKRRQSHASRRVYADIRKLAVHPFCEPAIKMSGRKILDGDTPADVAVVTFMAVVFLMKESLEGDVRRSKNAIFVGRIGGAFRQFHWHPLFVHQARRNGYST